jgi:hypothetical protein
MLDPFTFPGDSSDGTTFNIANWKHNLNSMQHLDMDDFQRSVIIYIHDRLELIINNDSETTPETATALKRSRSQSDTPNTENNDARRKLF